jgi:hypothetical protein
LDRLRMTTRQSDCRDQPRSRLTFGETKPLPFHRNRPVNWRSDQTDSTFADCLGHLTDQKEGHGDNDPQPDHRNSQCQHDDEPR